ncbi:MAG: hypothetical protein MJ164_02650 [Alphaproteobacteria bacterium]|nr:hypothetical protein [Alphaproteobacteria bacterium]
MIYHIYDKTKLTDIPANDANNTWLDFNELLTVNGINNDDVIVKELINSDDFLRAVLRKFNPEKRFVSHCFYFEKPDVSTRFIVSDAALNQFPDMPTRVKIVKNALDFCKNTKILGDIRPIVTFLNHSGHFNIKNPTACTSHLLVTECSQTMGNLADFSDFQLDCCLSENARKIKKIPQNRNSDIIIVNDINEGNSIVKSFLLNGWHGYGFLTGLDMRIVLNSRANLSENTTAVAKIAK